MAEDYDLACHGHRFAAWAAGRAASVSGCRFRVSEGKLMLEAAGLNADIKSAADLRASDAASMDELHGKWRRQVIAKAMNPAALGGSVCDGRKQVTHGVAAKLINVYLKARFLAGDRIADPVVAELHPPIDALLLKALATKKVGGQTEVWKKAQKTRWSKMSSDDYEEVIAAIRTTTAGKPLWTIEQYWPGYQ